MTLLRLFGTLFAVNMFTVGGGYVMLPLLHSYFVERYGWLTGQEFLDAVALGQLTPGPLTIMNVFIGYKVAGAAGAVAGAVGTYLPSLIVVMAVGSFCGRGGRPSSVDAVIRGIKPAVAGMLAGVALMLGTGSMQEPALFGVGLASFLVMASTKADPTLVIIGAGVIGAALI
ncbi:MAG TPA: chromate transporter [Nitrospirota bacterium]|jgi:chromate transporter